MRRTILELQYLRERIYGSLTLMAVNLGLLLSVERITPTHALGVVLSTAFGLWGASLLAEYISYRVTHDASMPLSALRHEFIVHRALLLSALPSVIILGFVLLDALSLRTGLIIDVGLAIIALSVTVFRSAKTAQNSHSTALISVGLQLLAVSVVLIIKLLAH